MSLQEHLITEYLPIPILINCVVVRCNLNRLTAVWKDALLDNCYTRSVLPLQGGLMTKTHYDESRFERRVMTINYQCFDNQNSLKNISPLAPALLSEKHYRIPTLRMVALSSATTHCTTNTFKPYFARPKEFAL